MSKATERMKIKQDSTYWEWSQNKEYIELLWILETEDGQYYQKRKTIRIGNNSDPKMPKEINEDNV